MSLDRLLERDKVLMADALRCDTNHFMQTYGVTRDKAEKYHVQAITMYSSESCRDIEGLSGKIDGKQYKEVKENENKNRD